MQATHGKVLLTMILLAVATGSAQPASQPAPLRQRGGIIHADAMPEVPQAPRPLVLKRVINIDEHTRDISVTWVRTWGHHDRVVNEISDRVYYIIEGDGRFQVGDGAPIENVRAGDFVYIPRNVPYEFDGKMRYIVMNGPAYRTDSDKVLPPVMK